ncbi:hypothetical protein B0H13DRAFT_1853776 [Mycena leptocephala]|nr:hypothetical protein B0H13DRAFT_1853776 [Mycena leptocephala]
MPEVVQLVALASLIMFGMRVSPPLEAPERVRQSLPDGRQMQAAPTQNRASENPWDTYRGCDSLNPIHQAERVECSTSCLYLLHWREPIHRASLRMPLPLLLRIELDRYHKPYRYLGNTAYDNDFVVTQDKSVASGSLCTFKRCEDEIEPTPTKRGCVLPFVAQIFGHIDQQFFVGKTQILHFGCADNISCKTKKAYDQQVATLACALKADSDILVCAAIPNVTCPKGF